MAGFDPATDPRVRQAVDWDRAQRGLPPLYGGDAIAAQDAALQQSMANDAAMSGVGAPPAAYTGPGVPEPVAQPMGVPQGQVDPASVMSVPPEQLPAEENVAAQMSEPLASYPGDQAAPAPVQSSPAGAQFTPEGIRALLTNYQRQAGGGGYIDKQLGDARARRGVAESQVAGYEAQGDQASADRQVAADELGAAREKTFADVAKIRDEQAKAADAYKADVDRISANTDKALSSTQKDMDDVGQWMDENKEPKDRRGWGQRIMGALAVAFGGLADQANLAASINAGTPVQTNQMATASALIQRQIDRDLEQQRAMFENQRTRLAAKQTEYGQLREKGYDDMQASAVKRALDLDRANAQIDAAIQRGLSAEQIPQANAIKAQLAEERSNLLLGFNEQRFQQAYARENQLSAAKAAAAAGPRPMTPMQQEELRGKRLDNAKKEQELNGGKPLSAEQLKRQSLFEGKDEAAGFIANLVAEGQAAPGMIGRNVPGWMRSAEGDRVDSAIASMKDVLLRDESGASISEGDKQSKVEAWGLDRGEEQRKRGLRMMLDEFNARRESVGLPPIEPVVRRGAAK